MELHEVAFTQEEKEKAEQILKILDGMMIFSAKSLLEKCEAALMANKVNGDMKVPGRRGDIETEEEIAERVKKKLRSYGEIIYKTVDEIPPCKDEKERSNAEKGRG